METELSVWHLIANAGILVQLVMLLLMLASVVSWALIFQRLQVFRKARQAQLEFEDRFWSGMDLGQLYKEVSAEPTPFSGMESVFRAGFKEFSRLRQQSRDADAVMEGTQRAMRVAFSREQERLETHLPFLATVGSTSPYVGLFGTVWGIMNSFRGLAQVQQATLSTVAPGIAEALIATAIGLFAAIPAVMIFNKFARDINGFVGALDNFSAEMIASVSRQLDEGR